MDACCVMNDARRRRRDRCVRAVSAREGSSVRARRLSASVVSHSTLAFVR
jgi:hypothetical protein